MCPSHQAPLTDGGYQQAVKARSLIDLPVKRLALDGLEGLQLIDAVGRQSSPAGHDYSRFAQTLFSVIAHTLQYSPRWLMMYLHRTAVGLLPLSTSGVSQYTFIPQSDQATHASHRSFPRPYAKHCTCCHGYRVRLAIWKLHPRRLWRSQIPS